MPARLLLLLTLALAATFAPLASAALVFEQTKITLDPPAPVGHLDAVFAFQNPGPGSVTVTEIKADCGCTVPQLDKKTYAAEETGQLKIRFDIGDRQGPQNRVIHVVTDDGTTHTLTLLVNLPLRSLLVPRLLLYRGPDTAAKVCTATYYLDLPVTITAVTSSDPAFKVSVETEKEGTVYKLVARLVEPVPSATARATVLVRSRGASGTYANDTFFLRYEPPAP